MTHSDIPASSATSDEGMPLGTWLEQRALDMIRAEFEARTWDAFWHATVDGRTAVEIAADLGMSKEAVRQAVGDSVAIRCPGTGPFALASYLIGTQNWLLEVGMVEAGMSDGQEAALHLAWNSPPRR